MSQVRLAATRQLPQQANLEKLRKQAKELLQQYRSGNPCAISEVRQFEHHPNPSAFALSDAQRVLARAYGYESWPKLKAFVDGVNIARFMEAVKCGDMGRVRIMLAARPELVNMDESGSNEHRGIHYAVLGRDVTMVRLLMEAGADAHKGIWPHRDATSALALAREREYSEIVAVIEQEEQLRREEASWPNATVSPVQEQIGAAILRGDAGEATRLLEADQSLIQACDRNGSTPLHIAAQASNVELTAWLIARRANPRKEDVRGLTPLDRAALAADPRNDSAQRFPQIAGLLLEHGAEVTIRAAIALGDAARVREFVTANPGLLQQIDSHGGLLSLAVNHGHTEIIGILLELGADIDERILLEELEEPTPSWGMPLWYAALAGNAEIAKLLLDRGADPNANVYASGWPLRNAWNHEDDSVKRLLLQRGAKPQPYMVAEAHDIEEAKRLLAADSSNELASELAWSAADHGCADIVELALQHLDWPVSDLRWHWVLIQPIRGATGTSSENEGYFRSMAILLDHGIDPDVQRFGQTALHFLAARHGLSEKDRAAFASLLLDHGANFNVRDDLLKSTPLGWACRWGRQSLVRLLMERGAPIDEPDAEPWATPQAWARKMKHDAVLAMLRRGSATP